MSGSLPYCGAGGTPAPQNLTEVILAQVLNRTTRLWYTSLAGLLGPVMLSEAKHLSARPFVALRVTRRVCQSSVV
jgi:hypothetical protein